MIIIVSESEYDSQPDQCSVSSSRVLKGTEKIKIVFLMEHWWPLY